jgi:hypothetical protein
VKKSQVALLLFIVVVFSVSVGRLIAPVDGIVGPPPPTTTPPPPTPEVPNIVGSTAAQAQASISAHGYDPKRKHDWSTKKKGTVFGQHPGAGSEADPGTTITYVVSDGLPSVPRWATGFFRDTGTPLKAAEGKLAKLDLRVGQLVYVVSNKFWLSPGDVASKPGTGDRVKPDTKVTLYVSKLPSCTPGYSVCLPPHVVGGVLQQYDCSGNGSGGPYFVYSTVRVYGSDPYGLDGYDNDGYGCE